MCIGVMQVAREPVHVVLHAELSAVTDGWNPQKIIGRGGLVLCIAFLC